MTQSFNTTTSMGRLTLNILLSFAQFERETTADRIRDKHAASRQKGIWMGGHPPLGYDIRNRELVVNPREAEQVRHIFRRFAECGSPTQVITELRASGIHNKSWTTSEGVHREGNPIHKAALYRILKNPVYIGEVGRGKRAARSDCPKSSATEKERGFGAGFGPVGQRADLVATEPYFGRRRNHWNCWGISHEKSHPGGWLLYG